MTVAPTTSGAPRSDVDLFTDDVLLDPHPRYEDLRESGSAVWLTAHDMWAIPRYHDLKGMLADWETYSSTEGVAIDPGFSAMLKGAFIALDPPEHRRQRQVLAGRLAAPALRALQSRIEAWADDHVRACLQRPTFDAVSELTRPYPIHVITSLIGFPKVDPERMAQWAAAGFQSLGPANERALAVIGQLGELERFLTTDARLETLPPGSFGAEIHEAAAGGQITREQAESMLRAYATAGIDTTVNALSSAIWLFARHPDQWRQVRADPGLIPAAFEEVLRLESPVQTFSRTVTRDHEIGGVPIAAGDRVMLLYGSANRDPRRWENPDVFDIRRSAGGHLAFGRGIHVCPGAGLARLEAVAVLTSLARRVERLDLAGPPVRQINNVVRGFAELEVTVRAA